MFSASASNGRPATRHRRSATAAAPGRCGCPPRWGRRAGRWPPFSQAAPAEARPAVVIYASDRVVIRGAMTGPAWTGDRGTAGTIIDRGEPVCTVRARAATTTAARAGAERRGARLLAQLAAYRYPHA